MSTDLVIVGCGGFGREVVELVRAVNAVAPTWTLLGVLDDNPRPADLAHLTSLGVCHLGSVAMLADFAPEVGAVIAIGSPSARREIDSNNERRAWCTLIHPDTTVGSDVRLAPGVVVAAGARLTTNIDVGRHAHIDQNVAIGHDSTIGAYARLNPQACVSGAVSLESEVLIGANATLLQGLRIGAGATVGAGAVVVRDVNDRTTVKGVPAR